MELLYVLREWLYGEGEELKAFTLQDLLTMKQALGMDAEDFTEFLTGYNCDSYADASCAIMEDIAAEQEGRNHTAIYDLCMTDNTFLTCYTVYRVWNAHHTPETALANWKDSCLSTLEGLGDT